MEVIMLRKPRLLGSAFLALFVLLTGLALRAFAGVPVGCHEVCFDDCGSLHCRESCPPGPGGGAGGGGGGGGTGGTGGMSGSGGSAGSPGPTDSCDLAGMNPTCDDSMYCGSDGDPYADDGFDGSLYQC